MSRLIDNSSQTLEEALKNTLPQTDRIDVLTAYFYFFGFSLLADELKDKHIRILVGKSIDPDAVAELSAAIKSYPNVDLNTYQNKTLATFDITLTCLRVSLLEFPLFLFAGSNDCIFSLSSTNSSASFRSDLIELIFKRTGIITNDPKRALEISYT
jgi:hypothetical protein